MSEVLAKQASELSQKVTILSAQLQAHKQIINELMEASVNLRTNLSLHQQANEELTNIKNKRDSEILGLKNEIEALKQPKVEEPKEGELVDAA